MTGLTHLRDLQVIPQQLLVVRMSTVLNNALCTLEGTRHAGRQYPAPSR